LKDLNQRAMKSAIHKSSQHDLHMITHKVLLTEKVNPKIYSFRPSLQCNNSFENHVQVF
jgi:hypothetical protein